MISACLRVQLVTSKAARVYTAGISLILWELQWPGRANSLHRSRCNLHGTAKCVPRYRCEFVYTVWHDAIVCRFKQKKAFVFNVLWRQCSIDFSGPNGFALSCSSIEFYYDYKTEAFCLLWYAMWLNYCSIATDSIVSSFCVVFLQSVYFSVYAKLYSCL